MRAIATLALSIFAALAVQAAQAMDKVTVGMASGVNQVPSLVAAERGYFKDEGLDVQLMPVVRGNLAVEAMVAGSMQFAEVSDVVLFSAVDKGIPLVAIGAGSRGFTGKMIGSNELGEVKSLADLKGKRIGMQVGTGVHGVFLILAEKEGLKAEDFQISNVRVTDMPTAMASPGTFDAVLGWDPMMQRIVQGGHGKEVISAKQFQEMAEITYPLLLVAKKDYVAQNPEVVQRLLNAYAKAHKWIRENPEGAQKIFSETLKKAGAELDETIVKTMMFEVDKFPGVGFVDSDPKELGRTRDFLQKTGKIATSPDLKDITAPEYAAKADALAK